MTPPPILALAAPISSDLLLNPDQNVALLAAARSILVVLSAGRKVDAGVMRCAMEQAFGGSDAEGLLNRAEFAGGPNS
jgi:hypothetical protein